MRCLQSKADRPVDVAIVGDSHAEHLFIGLADALADRNVAFYIKNAPPFTGRHEFDDIYAHVLASRSIGKVVLTMFWINRTPQAPAGSSLADEILRAAARLADARKEVYLTDDVPTYSFDPQRCAIRGSA